MSLCSRLREVFHVFLMVIGNRVVETKHVAGRLSAIGRKGPKRNQANAVERGGPCSMTFLRLYRIVCRQVDREGRKEVVKSCSTC